MSGQQSGRKWQTIGSLEVWQMRLVFRHRVCRDAGYAHLDDAPVDRDPSDLAAFYANFDDKQHSYYEHRIAA